VAQASAQIHLDPIVIKELYILFSLADAIFGCSIANSYPPVLNRYSGKSGFRPIIQERTDAAEFLR
jgi:hypothetical protein